MKKFKGTVAALAMTVAFSGTPVGSQGQPKPISGWDGSRFTHLDSR